MNIIALNGKPYPDLDDPDYEDPETSRERSAHIKSLGQQRYINWINGAIDAAGQNYQPIIRWVLLSNPYYGNLRNIDITQRMAVVLALCANLNTGVVEKSRSQIMQMWYAFKPDRTPIITISDKTLYNHTNRVREVFKPYVTATHHSYGKRTFSKTCFNLKLIREELQNETIGALFKGKGN